MATAASWLCRNESINLTKPDPMLLTRSLSMSTQGVILIKKYQANFRNSLIRDSLGVDVEALASGTASMSPKASSSMASLQPLRINSDCANRKGEGAENATETIASHLGSGHFTYYKYPDRRLTRETRLPNGRQSPADTLASPCVDVQGWKMSVPSLVGRIGAEIKRSRGYRPHITLFMHAACHKLLGEQSALVHGAAMCPRPIKQSEVPGG